MDRRSFLASLAATASGLLLPEEPRRVYSFARELRVPGGVELASPDDAEALERPFYGVDRRVEPASLAGVRIASIDRQHGIITLDGGGYQLTGGEVTNFEVGQLVQVSMSGPEEQRAALLEARRRQVLNLLNPWWHS